MTLLWKWFECLENEMSNRATEFSKDLIRELKKKYAFNKKTGIDEWKKDWKPKGVSHGGVDVAGIRKMKDKDVPIILIEAELRRDDPPANILKIWMWAREKRIPRNPLLLQAFSKAYDDDKKEQKYRAIFLGRRMRKDLRESMYRAVRLGYRPRAGGKVGAGRRHHHAQNLAASVVRICRSLIPRVTNTRA